MNSTSTSARHVPTDAQATTWDVVIAGAGIGGATLGYALARRGHSVLFLERGKLLFADPSVARGVPLVRESDAEGRMRHGRWPNPFRNVAAKEAASFYHPVGCGSGGSSAIFSMVMERFRPQDFTPRQYFPTVGESTVPDAWPIAYEDLEAYYAEAERLYRVRGSLDPLFRHQPLMRPPDATAKEVFYLEELAKCRLHPYRFHYACESLPGCTACTGTICARDCRNGAEKSCLRPALELHDAQILPDCSVTRLTTAGRTIRSAICQYQGRPLEVRGRIFVLAANAYLTPRLLLRSQGEGHAQGLANSSGLVGRNLMLHVSDHVLARPLQWTGDALMSLGIGLNDYYVVDGVKLGNVHAHPLEIPPDFSRDGNDSRSVLVFISIVEDLPYLHNRVLPPSGEQDDVAYEYAVPKELAQRSRMLVDRFRRDLHPHFETRLVESDVANLNRAHACGTCRFGDDPRASVLDRNNRAHDLDNLYVVDASFFPSSGGLNPSLTIAANALRVAERISERL